MKNITIVLTALGFALAASAAESHKVTLYQPAQINGKLFKAGELKLEIEGDNVVVKQGKNAVETKAKISQTADKNLRTTVGVDGDTKSVKEIRLGGSNTVLTFAPAGTASGNE